MKIKTVHCLFEQSGTFKNAFKSFGINAFDYDIQDNFGETDCIVDLFTEIHNGYDDRPSMFDNIGQEDLIMAFFPCIYFCEGNVHMFRFEDLNYRNLTKREKIEKILNRSKMRQQFYELVLKLFAIADLRGLRLIVENPYATQHFLYQYFPWRPSIIDQNRRTRGDFFVKPTQYWFVNCEATRCESSQPSTTHKTVFGAKAAPRGGLCSEERSLIAPDYALNFIADHILGEARQGVPQQVELF